MNRLICSFSGGRTSAYMTWRVLQEWKDQYDEIVVLFANTGLEHEKTLEFVKNCDDHFGFNTVWLEADVIPGKGNGTRHKIVDFKSASRDGEPYYDFARKYGIPSVGNPSCTRVLKVEAIRSCLRDHFGLKKRDYVQCIGIRVDEIDRMQPKAKELGIRYPLVNWGITKNQVLDWWASQDFDLDLPEHLGNCVTCFKKSDRKLFTIAKHHPEYFAPFQRMERELSRCGAWAEKTGQEARFFRKHRTTADIIASSKQPFIEWAPTDQQQQIGMFSLDELDISNGCTESCEVDFI